MGRPLELDFVGRLLESVGRLIDFGEVSKTLTDVWPTSTGYLTGLPSGV